MNEAIKALVESVEGIAPHVWSLMVRQARIDAWLSLFWFIANIGIAIAYQRILRTGWRKFKESDEDDFAMWDGSISFAVFAIFVGLMLAIMFPMSLTSAINGFINPEYVAIRTLLGLVKQ